MKGNINNAISLAAYPRWNLTNITYQFYSGPNLPTFYTTAPNTQTHYTDDNATPLADATIYDPAGFKPAEQAVATVAFTWISTFVNLTFTPEAAGQNAT